MWMDDIDFSSAPSPDEEEILRDMRKQTLHNLVNETVEWFTNNPRTEMMNASCQYLDSKGNRCAFGRYVKDEYIMDVHREEGTSASHVLEVLGDDIMKVSNIPTDFWEALQELHDDDRPWRVGYAPEIGADIHENIDAGWFDDD
jgi:hypothetical protein